MRWPIAVGIPLVECTLETKPLHVSADYAVTLKVEPIEATYDSVSNLKVLGNNNIAFWLESGSGSWFFVLWWRLPS